jgi:UDP-glucose 4-epimerase
MIDADGHRFGAREIPREVSDAFCGARVLITGAAGFIAGHLASALLASGAELILLDERPITVPELVDGASQIASLGVGSEEFRQFLGQMRPPDYLFHLAARAYAAGSVGEPYADFCTNLAATVELLETLRAAKERPRLLFASSAAVYGEPGELPITEANLTVPISPYGVSKLAGERYVSVYARLYDLSASSLRLFSVFGPGQRKQVVYDLFAKLRASPEELTVLGDGSQVRDFVFVKDIVSAFLTVAARGRSDGSAYNVASGVGTSIAHLAREIVAAQQPGARIAFTGATRPGDPDRWIGSAEPLRALGWEPAYSLRDGLRETAAWFNALPDTEPPRAEGAL